MNSASRCGRSESSTVPSSGSSSGVVISRVMLVTVREPVELPAQYRARIEPEPEPDESDGILTCASKGAGTAWVGRMGGFLAVVRG